MKNSSNKAVCLLETLGFSVAMQCADKVLKSTHTSLMAVDINNPKKGEAAKVTVSVQLKMKGSVSAVTEAVEIFRENAERIIPRDDIYTAVLSNPEPDLGGVLKLGKVKRKKYEGQVYPAIAIIEVLSFAASAAVLDRLMKSTESHLISCKKYLGGQLSTIIVGGKVDSMREAADIALSDPAQQRYVKSALVIANPSEEILDYLQ